MGYYEDREIKNIEMVDACVWAIKVVIAIGLICAIAHKLITS